MSLSKEQLEELKRFANDNLSYTHAVVYDVLDGDSGEWDFEPATSYCAALSVREELVEDPGFENYQIVNLVILWEEYND